MRKILHHVPAIQAIAGAGGNQIETNDPLPAPLSPLAAGFLKGHVEAGEGVIVLQFQRHPLSAHENFLGRPILHGNKVALALLAEILQILLRTHMTG